MTSFLDAFRRPRLSLALLSFMPMLGGLGLGMWLCSLTSRGQALSALEGLRCSQTAGKTLWWGLLAKVLQWWGQSTTGECLEGGGHQRVHTSGVMVWDAHKWEPTGQRGTTVCVQRWNIIVNLTSPVSVSNSQRPNYFDENIKIISFHLEIFVHTFKRQAVFKYISMIIVTYYTLKIILWWGKNGTTFSKLLLF